MNLLIALLLVLLAFCLIAGALIGWQGHKFIQRIESLEQISKRRKLPYPAMAGLEDALALIDDGQFETGSMDKVITYLLMLLQKDLAARKYLETRLDQVQDILMTVRADPQGYKADGSAGKNR